VSDDPAPHLFQPPDGAVPPICTVCGRWDDKTVGAMMDETFRRTFKRPRRESLFIQGPPGWARIRVICDDCWEVIRILVDTARPQVEEAKRQLALQQAAPPPSERPN